MYVLTCAVPWKAVNQNYGQFPRCPRQDPALPYQDTQNIVVENLGTSFDLATLEPELLLAAFTAGMVPALTIWLAFFAVGAVLSAVRK
jgi:hypothetical protein